MLIAGVDEVGRGPLAGQVVTAAVILDSKKPITGLTDSKALSEKNRDYYNILIQENALAFAYGYATEDEIDALNIHFATLLAMERAVNALSIKPDEVWVDGRFALQLDIPSKAFVKGDLTIPVISAASILAKVKRDAQMYAWDQVYPQYGFAKHKGYPTVQHLHALEKWGVSPIHRKSFAPVKKLLTKTLEYAGV